MLRPHGAVGVGRPDRSVSMGFAGDVAGDPLSYALPDLPLKDLERAAELAEELESIVARMPPGSFTQDPGMRAGDEFSDVTSAGYRESAERVAERGGAKEYATSVEEEEADAEADTLRNRVGTALAAMVGLGSAGALGAASRPLVNRGATGLTRHGDRYLDRMVQAGHKPNVPGRGLPGHNASPSLLNDATVDALRASGRLPTPTLNPGFLQQQERLLGRGFQGRMNPMPPGSQPGMADRIMGALDGGRGARAIDTAAFGGMASPMVYDMIQRRRRGARPFGPGE